MDPSSLTIHHNITGPPPPPPAACNGGEHVHHHSVLLHPAFYWGKDAVVLFSGWPGTSSVMYGLALTFVFVLALLVEFFTHWNFVKPGSNRAGKGFVQAGIYGVRIGLSYMVMLAVISYNAGIFLAAMIGHAVGFAAFNRVFKKG